MKKIKYLRTIPIILLILSILTGCSNQTVESNTVESNTVESSAVESSAAESSTVESSTSEVPEALVSDVQLINPMGPAVIPVAGLYSQNVTGDVSVDIEYWKTGDEAIGLLSQGETEFAVLPITTGVNMVASGLDLKLLGVHEWKVFYLIASEGSEFTDWNSLVGKTIYTPESKGQTVDVITRYALMNENIEPDQDVTFVYAPGAEIVTLFQEGKVDYAALPEPFVSQALASSNGSIVLDYQDYWAEVSGAQDGIPIAGLFVQSEFLDEHPATVSEVVQMFSQSTQWANENTEAAVEAVSDVLPLSSDILLSSLQRIKFEYISAKDAQDQVIDFLTTLQETYPEGIKMIPEDDFFAPG